LSWAKELGFAGGGVADIDLRSAEAPLLAWLEAGFHGDMDYMERHGVKRARPAELVPGTVRVLTFRMDYLGSATPKDWARQSFNVLKEPATAVISWYARGRDYHKVVRSRLERLALRIAKEVGPFGYRAFTDSAPVLEVEIAQRAGIGWRGKHTLALSRDGGSMFFLGEIFVDLPLPVTEAASAHCGRCEKCIDICPTKAILAPYQLDARRCISYLTIEHQGAIPIEFRRAIGNRVYGCDDCQAICPWNKYAKRSALPDFDSRGFEKLSLIDLFLWSEETFLRNTEGSPIRRIGHVRWLRNFAVALGNALAAPAGGLSHEAIAAALRQHLEHPHALVREHVLWALAQGAL
jgi:epoxyqueuosine reductase